MIQIEHKLKSIQASQILTAMVTGPAPATHLFICTGIIIADAGRVVKQSGIDLDLPGANLSFYLPGNDQQPLSLVSHDGTPLKLISATTFAAFTVHMNSRHINRREMRGWGVYQQDQYAVLVIDLYIDTHMDVTLSYQVSILAAPYH